MSAVHPGGTLGLVIQQEFLVVGAVMAKKKLSKPKNKAREGPGFRTLGIRMSHEYAQWLADAAKHDRVTIAAFLDKAAAEHARAVGFQPPPPERIP
jgi:hypothetical protein